MCSRAKTTIRRANPPGSSRGWARLVLLLGVLGAGLLPALAQGPQWPQYQRSSTHPGSLTGSVPAFNAPNPGTNLKWTLDTGRWGAVRATVAATINSGTATLSAPVAAADTVLNITAATIGNVQVGDMVAIGNDPLGSVLAVDPALNTVTVAAPGAQIAHANTELVLVTKTAALSSAITADGVDDDIIVLTAATLGKVHVGDILIVEKDYLGPVLSVDRTTRQVRTTYPATTNHAATAPVQISLFRQDVITEGDARSYGSISRAVPANTIAGTAWSDSSNAAFYNPAVRAFTLSARITPLFTDDAGKLLQQFRGDALGGEEIRFGFMENDPNVSDGGEPFTDTNGNGIWDPAEPFVDANGNGTYDPGETFTDVNRNGRWDPAEPYTDLNGNGVYDAGSPQYIHIYIKDNGEIGLRRKASDTFPPAMLGNITLTAGRTLMDGIEVRIFLEPIAGGARATAQYRVADATGLFTGAFTTIGTFYDLPVAPEVLANALYPFAQGYDLLDPKPGFALRAENITISLWANPLDPTAPIIGPGSSSFKVAYPERFLVGDKIEILHPTDATKHEMNRIRAISGGTIYLASAINAFTYPAGAIVRAGQPGMPAAYVGADDGLLRAVNPETTGPDSYWTQSGLHYLAGITGAPAIDSQYGRVYVTSLSGRLFGFSQNGQFLWAYPALDQPALDPLRSAPVIDAEGNIYFVSDYGRKTTSDATRVFENARIYKIDPDGKLAAAYPSLANAALGASLGGPALYTTAAGELRVVFGAAILNGTTLQWSGRLYSLDKDLKLIWSYDAGATMGAISATPVIGSDGTIYIGDEKGLVHAVYENAGVAASRWLNGVLPYAYPAQAPIEQAGAVRDAAAPALPVLYVGDRNGTLYALSGATQAEVEANVRFAHTHAANTDPVEPITAPPTLDAGGNLLVCTEGGSVYSFDPAAFVADPAVFVAPIWKWNAKQNAAMAAGLPIRTAPTLWNGGGVIIAMVGSDDGNVYAISADGSSFPNTIIPQPSDVWPFFHRDGRRQGDLSQMRITDSGPLQPTLRWWAAHNAQKLTASPVVTDCTPDGSTRVYQGTESGKVVAYNGSTGAKITTFGSGGSGEYQLDGRGPVRGTPAVHNDPTDPAKHGMLAVPGMDGRLYVLKSDGTLRSSTGSNQGPQRLLGNFQASPVFAKDGTIYAATADDLNTAGVYRDDNGANLSALETTAMRDGNDTTAAAGKAKINYFTYDPAAGPGPYPLTQLTCIRIQTGNKGTLRIYRTIGVGNTEQVFERSFPSDTDPKRFIHVDVDLDANRVEWTNEDTTASVSAFEVYSAGMIAQLPAHDPAGAAPAANHVKLFVGATQFAAPPPTLIGPVITARLYNAANTAAALFIDRVVLVFNATVSGQLTIVDSDGVRHTWRGLRPDTGTPYTIPVNRMVKEIRWASDDPGIDSQITRFDVYERDLGDAFGGSRVFAIDPATGRYLWKYPTSGHLPSITASPTVSPDAATPTDHKLDVIFVTTLGGQVLALRDNTVAVAETALAVWQRDVFERISGSPVQADTPDGGMLFVNDEGGNVHLMKRATGANAAGWPQQIAGESFSASAAVTAENMAYLISDQGHVYLLDLQQIAGITPTVTVPNAPPGPTNNEAPNPAPAVTSYYNPQTRMLTIVARIVPQFTDDAGAPLTAFRAAPNGQVARFVLRAQDGSDFARINLTDDGKLSFETIAVMGTATMPAGSNPQQGVELALTISTAQWSQATVNAYYRTPDLTGGQFTGAFHALGSVQPAIPAALRPLSVYPFLRGEDANGRGFTITGQIDIFQGWTPDASAILAAPGVWFLRDLGTSVHSSPVIDATGRLFVGSEIGTLFCLEPGTAATLWSYTPARSMITTTLTESVSSGTQQLKVTSVLGFKAGDLVEITQPDGSQIEDLGTVLDVTPATGADQTTTTQLAPDVVNPRRLVVTSTAGMAVGDDVNILATSDPLGAPQFLRFLGKVAQVVDANTLIIDRDIDLIDLDGDGTAAEQYPIGSEVFVGPTYGVITVSRGPGQIRRQGDILRVKQRFTLPIRTSPSIGPFQAAYVGADDGILYAIGPVGPAGVPDALPPLVEQVQSAIWPTFHQNEQRAGYADRKGVRYPGTIFDPNTGQYSVAARWITDTSARLFSSPALGYADDNWPLGVLYVGTVTQPVIGGSAQVSNGGNFMAMDANWGGVIWRYDDNGNMGQVSSSPTVVDITRTDEFAETTRDELVIFGTEDLSQLLSSSLIGARILDNNGNEQLAVLGITANDKVTALLVSDASQFFRGMDIALTDSGTGANFEYFGTIASIVQEAPGRWLVRLTTTITARFDHIFVGIPGQVGTTVRSHSTQQGHVYALDRKGNFRWKFPRDGSNRVIDKVFSSPAASSHEVAEEDYARSRIYVADRSGVIYALDLDGNEVWNFAIDSSQVDNWLIDHGGQALPGAVEVISSPALDRDSARLFIGVRLLDSTTTGYVIALDLTTEDADKRLLWVRKLDGQVDASPLFMSDELVGDRIYIGTDVDNGKFYCLKAEDGTDLFPPLALGPVFGTAAAVPETKQVRINKPRVQADGKTVIISSTTGLYAGMRVRLRSNASVVENKIFRVVNATTIELYTPIATANPEKVYDSLWTNEQVIVVGTMTTGAVGGRIYAMTERLELLGNMPTNGNVAASPALSTEMDIVQSGVRSYSAYVGSTDFYLYGLTVVPVIPDPGNPNITFQPLTKRWEAFLYESLESSPVVGMTADDANGQAILYQAGGDERVYAFPGDTVITEKERKYQRRSSLDLRKAAVNTGNVDPATGAASPYRWWKFSLTVRNVGQSPIDDVTIYDNLPASVCSPPIAPDVTPPQPYDPGEPFTDLNNDRIWQMGEPFVDINGDGTYDGPGMLAAIRNRGTVDDPQWELAWPKVLPGYTLQPGQSIVLTFYVAVRDTNRDYSDLGTKLFVTDKDSVMLTGAEMTDPPKPVLRKIGDTVYLQFFNHPIPREDNSAEGQNQVYAQGTSYEGYDDQPLSPVTVEAQTQTPVRVDWTDGDRSFQVRMYYNGRGKDPTHKRLANDGTGDIRAFSPWNQTNPDTGDPLVFKVTRMPRPGTISGASIGGATGAYGVRMVSFKVPELGIGTSGIAIPLLPNAQRFDTLRKSYAVVDSSVTSYGWRLSIQQGKSQAGSRIEWGDEMFYEDRVLLTTVTAPAANSTTLQVSDGSRVKPHHILVIGDNSEGYVVSVAGNTITFAQGVTAAMGDEVRDEWSPDMVIQNPVAMAAGLNGDKLTMADMAAPGNTASTPTLSIRYEATPGQWGAMFNNFTQYRFMVSPIDLRHPQATANDFNELLDWQTGYWYGVPTSGWSDWKDFRYDPYRENHIPLTPESLDVPLGTALRPQQQLRIHMTSQVPGAQYPSLRASRELSTAGGVVYLELNNTNGYQAGFEPRLNDVNGNGKWDLGEIYYLDNNNDGAYQPSEQYIDRNDNGVWDAGEPLDDVNGNGIWDRNDDLFLFPNVPLDLRTAGGVLYLDLNSNKAYDWGIDARLLDANGNNRWDPGERYYFDSNNDGVFQTGTAYTDTNGNGKYDAGEPTFPLGTPYGAGEFYLEIGAYTTAPEGLAQQQYDAAAGTWFLDLNNDGVYTAVAEPRLDDRNGNNQPDPAENYYFDLSANGVHDVGEPALATARYETRIFMDMNGNRVFDAGEPYFVAANDTPANIDYAAWDPAEPFTDTNGNGKYDAGEPFEDQDGNGLYTPARNLPIDMSTLLGVSPQTILKTVDPVVDMNRSSLLGSFRLPSQAPSLQNAGNLMLFGYTAEANSSLAISTAVSEAQLPDLLLRTGAAGVLFNPAGNAISLRTAQDYQPFFFKPYLAPYTWGLPKSPAGMETPFSRPLDLPMPGIKGNQPTGTYTADVKLGTTDTTHGVSTGTSMTMRVSESGLSHVIPAPFAQTPPRIDIRHAQTVGLNNWTAYLTGSESWPTASVLSKKVAANQWEPDVPGVWVASNTPLPPGVVPNEWTDTNIWYRRTKHLVSEATADVANGDNYIRLPKEILVQVRTTDGAVVDHLTSDIVILRRKPVTGEGPQIPGWYARITGHDAAGITIDPPVDRLWPKDQTVVEILSHPWLPLFDAVGVEAIRTTLADPGNPGNPVDYLRPLRLTQPSVTMDAAADPWLIWSTSAVRRITNAGQVGYRAVSYLMYKKFNPDRPMDNQAFWIGIPDTPDINGQIVYPNREHPVLLPEVAGLGGLAMYDSGDTGRRQLLYAHTADPLPTQNWTADVPVGPINWAFLSTSNPTVWADSTAAGTGPQTPMSRINLIFQGRSVFGNTDLYYARLSVNGAVNPPLGLLPLELPESDATGVLTEDFTNSGNGTFTGGRYLAWANGTKIFVNGEETTVPLVIDDSKQTYTLDYTNGAGLQFRLEIDPYRGLVRVRRGTANSVTFKGKARLQRLTSHLSPDVNPMVSVERWRYLTVDWTANPVTVTPNFGPDNWLQSRPRVWLFWTRQHEDGLGPRAYYRTLRMYKKDPADPEYLRLDIEGRGKGATGEPFTDTNGNGVWDVGEPYTDTNGNGAYDAGEVSAASWNVDVPERMLPMSVMGADGSLFVTRLSSYALSPESGVWAFSTASRGMFPYVDPNTVPAQELKQYTLHDLFLQVLNVPVPDNYRP